MKDRIWIITVIAVLLAAFTLRFYDCTYPPTPWMDEAGHCSAAVSYWKTGLFGPDNWEHPPLRHYIQYLFLKLFGDNPYGWRLRNILFGSLAAALTCLFGRQATGSRRVGILAGLMLATDPLHIVLSRYTWEEIYGGAFFVAAMVCYMKFIQNPRWLPASALLLGCALATKWYYVPAWCLLYFVSLYVFRKESVPRCFLYVSSIWLLLPLSVYTMSYWNWFGRGYTLREFVDFIVNAYYSLQSYRSEGYNPNILFLSHTRPVEWFVSTVSVGQGTYVNADTVECILYMNNLPIWIMTIPSLVAVSFAAVKRRSLQLALPAYVFCAGYLLYVVVKRPAFIYSAVPLLPFAFTMVSYCLVRGAMRFGPWAYPVVLVTVVGWNLFLYPLVTAKKVPLSRYEFILKHSDVKIVN